MIDIEYVRMMARYCAWQNTSITKACEALDDSERHKNRGAFFGSIAGTLNHLLWGDRIWMHRFAETEKPHMGSISESIDETDGWDDYRLGRTAMDVTISDWAQNLEPKWLEGDLSWVSSAGNRQASKPRSVLVVHFFNHGTHHRGQVHAMLTAAGVRPESTDIPLLPI